MKAAAAAGAGTPPPPPARVVKVVVQKEKAMAIDFHKNILESKEDVDEYINALRKQLLDYIEKNKSIMLK